MTTWKSSSAPESVVALLCALEDEGFDLEVVDGRVRVSPARRLTASHRAAIKKHRDDLIVLVQSCDPGVMSSNSKCARYLNPSPIIAPLRLESRTPKTRLEKGTAFSEA